MMEDSARRRQIGDVLEMGDRSFIFDGEKWQPSVSPAGQALIQQLGERAEPLHFGERMATGGMPQGWPVQVVVSPPDYDRQAKTFITVWLKYLLLLFAVVGVVGLLFMLISGGVFAAIVTALF